MSYAQQRRGVGMGVVRSSCAGRVAPRPIAVRGGKGHTMCHTVHGVAPSSQDAPPSTSARVHETASEVLEGYSLRSDGGEGLRDEQTSSSSHPARHMDIGMSVGAVVVAGALGMALLLPGNAHAAEALSGGLLETFKDFLDFVENSGTSGAVIFVLVVTALEMVPLLPTQPLTISAGLIFGAGKGSALIILAAMLAAVGAFLISRGVGRSLAEKVVVKEAGEHGPVQAKIAEVTRAIRQGGPWQQLTAVLLMRLTPVVPFSAANYVLGMTPIGLPAYIVATFLGASVWAGLYCSLGAASRGLLEGGMDIGELLADISVQAGSYSGTAAKVLVPLALVAGVGYFALNRGDSTPPPPPGGAPPAAEGEGAGGNGAAAGSASSASMDADVAQATGDAAPPAAAPGPATAEAASQAASGVGVR